MICPNCKSEKTEEWKVTEDNGIFGPGYASRVVDSWWRCLVCGMRFDKPPKEGE